MKRLLTIALLLTCIQLQAQTVIGNMETWRPVPVADTNVKTFELPLQWYSTDSVIFFAGTAYPDTFLQQVYKTNDAHGGTSAVKMVSAMQGKNGTLGIFPALFSNAKIDIDLTAGGSPEDMLVYSGGMPTTNRIDKVSAWVKYYPKADDSASLRVSAYMKAKKYPFGDSLIGEGSVLIGGTINTYTKVEAKVSYPSAAAIPSMFRVFVASGTLGKDIDSSVLYVDDISYEVTTGISSTTINNSIRIYPNPSAGTLYIDNKNGDSYSYTLVSMDGKMVDNKLITGSCKFDYNHLPNGIYCYTLRDSEGHTEMGKLRIEK